MLGEVSEEPGSVRVPTGEIRERAASKPTRMGRVDVRVSQLVIQALGNESDGEEGDDTSDMSSDKELQTRKGLPPGWSATVKTSTNGRKYKVFKGPQGTRQMYSLPAAWAEHDRLVGAESDTELVPSLEQESEEGSGEESEPVVTDVELGTSVVAPALEFFEITLGSGRLWHEGVYI